jgi:hypothetical protein
MRVAIKLLSGRMPIRHREIDIVVQEIENAAGQYQPQI